MTESKCGPDSIGTRFLRLVRFSSYLLGVFAFMIVANPAGSLAQTPAPSDTIPPGTKITMQNWQQYKQFMPDGLAKMFAGEFFWKLPADAAIEIGPTTNIPLPPAYVSATEKYGGQARVVHLPNGHLDVANYVGGEPFPNPQEPDKGYKVLANLWYSYRPHLNVTDFKHPVRDCIADRFANMACESIDIVYRQEGYNTDPGIPVSESDKCVVYRMADG
jgi:uncharacterized protein DUF1329